MSTAEGIALGDSSQRFSDLDHMPVGVAVLDEALTVLYWNWTLEDWTGIGRHEVLGRPMASLNPEWADPHIHQRLEGLFKGGPPVVFSPLLHPHLIAQASKEERVFRVLGTAVPAQDGWWAFLCVEDITVLSRRVEELREMHERQDRLMREIHHRVKNNLNMISGLISLQKIRDGAGAATAELDDLQSRIVAISEIHDVLYHSTSLSVDSTAGYLETLAKLLNKNLSLSSNHNLVFDLDRSVVLKTDSTVLLGLVQAELITNALKYAIKPDGAATIWVRFRRVGTEELEYELSHSGDTLPEGFDPATSEGLGMVLLTAYASQLGTTLGWQKGDPTRFWLRFPG
jgi:PAS domain S-box-containing protein